MRRSKVPLYCAVALDRTPLDALNTAGIPSTEYGVPKFPGDRLIRGLRQGLKNVIDLLVEAIHIQLSNETVPIRVLEVFTKEKPGGGNSLAFQTLKSRDVIHTLQTRSGPSR